MTPWSRGVFDNGMAWSCFGNGEKVALQIPGGPGNLSPDSGWWGSLLVKPFRPLVEGGFRIVTVTRKRNMKPGHDVAAMARDYAQLISDEFSGAVDLVIGTSFGGMISQYLAANHADTFKHIVVVVAGCRVDEVAGVYDQQYAAALASGDVFAAGAALAQGFYPQAKFPRLTRLLVQLTLPLLVKRGDHEFFSNDLLIEAEAERSFDSRPILPTIRKPVLVLAGDQDQYFPKPILEETQRLVPDCRLRIYEGKTHLSAFSDPRVGEDILNFISR